MSNTDFLDSPEFDDDWYDDEDEHMDNNCPCCGTEYDEIDYEYQICHICKYNNNTQ